MTNVALAAEYEPPDPPDGCWCCGDLTVRGSLLRLGNHPEVGVCFKCVGWLAKREHAIERSTRRAPAGPWWRRTLFRSGFSRC